MGTAIFWCRFPARSTTIAVITLVMLPIGNSVFMPSAPQHLAGGRVGQRAAFGLHSAGAAGERG